MFAAAWRSFCSWMSKTVWPCLRDNVLPAAGRGLDAWWHSLAASPLSHLFSVALGALICAVFRVVPW